MKNKIFKMMIVLLSIGGVISIIFLTNDSIKEKFNAGQVIPGIVIGLILLTTVVILWSRNNQKG